MVSGPMSTPMRLPMAGSPTFNVSFDVTASILSATTWSTGRPSWSPRFLIFASISRAASCLSSSTSDLPTGTPLAFRKVYAIAPPMISLSTRDRKFWITSILSETFAPPRIATSGRSGLFSTRPRYSSSFLHQQARGGARHELRQCRPPTRGRPVRRAERIVHVEIGERRQLLRERRIVLFLFRVKAKVLEQQHAPARARSLLNGGLRRCADAIFSKRHRTAKQLAKLRGHRLQAVFRVRLAFRPAEM